MMMMMMIMIIVIVYYYLWNQRKCKRGVTLTLQIQTHDATIEKLTTLYYEQKTIAAKTCQ